jgi:SAM-dependent methyltransferase
MSASLPTHSGDLQQMVDRRSGHQWLSRIWRLIQPPALLVPNPNEAEPAAKLGRWNLYVGGSGNQVSGYVNLDLFPGVGVDVVADAALLPFRDGVFSIIECDAVLEHVPHPEKITAEFQRTAEPGAWLHVVVPFCHPFHAYPDDFRRFTPQGLAASAPGWTLIRSGWRTGPTATLLIVIIEWAKLWFRSPIARGLVHAALGWILWPLRYCDHLWWGTGQDQRLGNHCFVWFRKS